LGAKDTRAVARDLKTAGIIPAGVTQLSINDAVVGGVISTAASNESEMMCASLGMAQSAQQEAFGDAFLLALAGVAGCAASPRRPDDDSIDWTLSAKLSRRPKLDIQMKTWTGDDGAGDPIRYDLKAKNYRDLILVDVCAPRILVLVTIPSDSASG
jgi:Domain of unknown function (DUF4365)